MLSYHGDLCRLIGWAVVDLFSVGATIEAEIWIIRQQTKRSTIGLLCFTPWRHGLAIQVEVAA
jgi:hypothetical protein